MPVPRIDHETAEPQTLDEILHWHGGVVEALVEQRASVRDAIRAGSPVAARFKGMTKDDVDAHFDAALRNLECLTMLNLVASAEATIKVDYFRRVGDRKKDNLAHDYQAWHKNLSPKKQLRPDFDDSGILDVLKESHVMDNNLVGRFRECLRVRHWVGHGRYWAKPVEVDHLDPDDVYDRANALLLAMPA